MSVNLADNENRYDNLAKPETLENPLAATHMGLIDVNSKPDPLKTAAMMRETFVRRQWMMIGRNIFRPITGRKIAAEGLLYFLYWQIH